MLRITSHYFVAGAIIKDGIIIRCAPILEKHILGMTINQVYRYIKLRGWGFTRSR